MWKVISQVVRNVIQRTATSVDCNANKILLGVNKEVGSINESYAIYNKVGVNIK
jgi:hypothetical protein